MRKIKRDVHRRAFLRGYQAGLQGRSRDLCPASNRADWLAGWRDGRSDLWDGRTGVSGIQSNPMIA